VNVTINQLHKMTPEQKNYLQMVLTDLQTVTEKYLFKDYVELVKKDNFLLESFEFVYLMYLQGRKEAKLKLDNADEYYIKMLDFFNDKEFAQYASRLHFILMVIK